MTEGYSVITFVLGAVTTPTLDVFNNFDCLLMTIAENVNIVFAYGQTLIPTQTCATCNPRTSSSVRPNNIYWFLVVMMHNRQGYDIDFFVVVFVKRNFVDLKV